MAVGWHNHQKKEPGVLPGSDLCLVTERLLSAVPIVIVPNDIDIA
jgi:hypothetical protein